MCIPQAQASESPAPSILEHAPKDFTNLMAYGPEDIQRLVTAVKGGATRDLSRLPFGVLHQMRKGAPADIQAVLGPADHHAYARDAASTGPVAAVQQALMIPVYSAKKAAGMTHARSPASLHEVTSAYSGVLEGLSMWRHGAP